MGTDVPGATEINPVLVARTEGAPNFVCVTGPSAGRTFLLSRSTATVGRHPTNDFVIEDPRISGTHLELTRIGDSVHVHDIGSTNGTWLAGQRVRDLDLAPGAELTIGDSLLRLQLDGAAVVPPLPDRASFGDLVGQSPVMRELFATLERIAPKELSVLVQGETGTGKEEVARAIHVNSRRAKGPFVVIDATSLPETLADSLLFGHERGAFTGAHERQRGFFEMAEGGTVFIDEVGELPNAVQSKFLRVLERREVVRVGAGTPFPIDVRVIAATNRDLRNAIEKGKFREDLYYRLAQVRVFVPPLRQRTVDLPLLCAKLLSRASSDAMIDVEALEHLASMTWPGNVRELNNVLLRASALMTEGVIRRADIAGEGEGFRGTGDERTALDLTGTFAEAKERALDRFEKAYLAMVMKRSRGNLSAAARTADLARHYFRDLLKRRGLYGVTLDEDE